MILPSQKVASIFQGIDYFNITVKENSIILKPVKITPVESTLEGVRDKIAVLGLKDEDVKRAIRWARRKSA